MTRKTIARVKCMDGRISEAVKCHTESLYGMCGDDYLFDDISVVGAVGMLADPKLNRILLKSLRVAIETHGAREVNLYAHSNCGYYREMKDEKIANVKQIEDAKEAKRLILKKFNRCKIVVNVWWIGIIDDKEGLSVVQKIKEE